MFHIFFLLSLLFAFLALNGRVKGEKEVAEDTVQGISSFHEMDAKAK